MGFVVSIRLTSGASFRRWREMAQRKPRFPVQRRPARIKEHGMHVAISSLMRTNLLLSAALLLGMAACDNSSSSSTTGSTSSGGDGGSGGPGGGATCVVASTFNLDVSVNPPAGAPTATCVSAETTVAFDGKVRTKDGEIYVDTCGPAADCLPSEVKIHVGGAGFTSADAQTIPNGTFVHVVWTASPAVFGGTGCDNAVLVRNLPTWQGVANPTAGHTSLWLFATRSSPLSSVGVDDDRAALKLDEELLCSTMDLEPSSPYALKLTATDAKVSAEAQPGLRATLMIPSGAQKGDYALINDLVAVLGDSGFAKSYVIVRTAP